MTTLVLYGLIGSGVSVAVWLQDQRTPLGERLLKLLTAFAFWPLYVPVLLRPSSPPTEPLAAPPPADELDRLIQQVEAEMDALGNLDGWAGDVLSRERDCLAELRAAWRAQAGRVRELDRLLARPALDLLVAAPLASQAVPARLQQSERSRRDNLALLQEVRERLHRDLLSTLAWVRQLVTQIHLAKYTGAPPARTEELVQQIAASVEGLSEATTWRDQ